MTEPLTTITAATILTLALGEFIKGTAGTVGTKMVEGAIALTKTLREKLKAKFKGNPKAEIALATIEQEGSEAALKKLEVYLDDEMTDDPLFAEEIRQVAQQILQINQGTSEAIEFQIGSQTAGRDVLNIGKVEGQNNKLGGS